MRDWFWPLAPVATVIYFIAFPGHLGVFVTILDWVNRVTH
jgi:hypothetical protein